jgi:FkbM family methyltransferase
LDSKHDRAAPPDESTQTPLLENGRVRLKRCRHGWMLYLKTDQYIGRSFDLYGEFSEGEIDLFRRIVGSGQTVVEVGANIGAHTLFLAQAVGQSGRIVAFEPQRILFQILCANLALNALGNVEAYQAAVGRSAGRTTVPNVDYSQFNNFGGLSLGNHRVGESVDLVTLDALALEACHLIKIDVEGMEGDVLAGATKTISRLRPVLYVENDREQNSAALIERLLSWDYRLYWHLPPMFNEANFFGNRENAFGRIVSVNMLCLPRAIAQDIQGLREITTPDDSWRVDARVNLQSHHDRRTS